MKNKGIKIFASFAILFCVAFLGNNANAQIKIGGGLSYGFDISKPGINLKGIYEINEQIRLSPNVNIFFPEKIQTITGFDPITFQPITGEIKTSLMTINLDGHYIFSDSDFKFYGVGGINIAFVSVKGGGFSASDSSIGLNLGVGGEMVFSDALSGFSEFKFVVGDASQPVLTVGVLFSL